jgi:hypothetical protein
MSISDKSHKDIENIVHTLSLSGIDHEGKSIFLSETPESNQLIIMNFMRMHDISMDFFVLCENILRFANFYNALRAILNLQDKNLELEIFTRLRDPDFFIKQYGLDHGESVEGLKARKNIIQEGFTSFIDELHIPKESIFSLSPGILAEKFMIFASEGECTKDDDTKAFKVLSLVIADDLERNAEAIKKQEKLLALANV